MTTYIDAHRDRFGVEPICQALAVAPSTYYAARTRPPSARACRDAELRPEVTRVHRENFGVYGVARSGTSWAVRASPSAATGWPGSCARAACAGYAAVRSSAPRKPTSIHPARPTWSSASSAQRRRTGSHVADLTYVTTWQGFAYVAFVIDAYSRRILGWRVSSSLRSDLALDALNDHLLSLQQASVATAP